MIFNTDLQNTIIKKIVYDGDQAVSNKQIAKSILSQYRTGGKSQLIKDMLTANLYYLVQNEVIAQKTRAFKDNRGNTVENKNASNAKLVNAYYRKAVKQRANYAIGKPFMYEVKCEDAQLLATYQDWLKKIFNQSAMTTFFNIGIDSINKGIGWINIYINAEGVLSFKRVAPETVYPAWTDVEHTTLDAVVRDYINIEIIDGAEEEVSKVEFWDDQIVERYIDKDGELEIDIVATHFKNNQLEEMDENTAVSQIQEIQSGWGKVPFVAIKSNQDELPLLAQVKSFIDETDLLDSKSTDSLKDDIEPTIVIKNVSAEINSALQARKIMQESRIIVVDADGDVDVIKIDTNIDSVEKKLESFKKKIREFTNTVDTQDIKFGSNPSGIALKSMYQDMDTATNEHETLFKNACEQIKYFIDVFLSLINVADYDTLKNTVSVEFAFNRDMMINETDLIDNTVKLSALVSQETLDGYNPVIMDHETEQLRRKKDAKEKQSEIDIFKKQIEKDMDTMDVKQDSQDSEVQE